MESPAPESVYEQLYRTFTAVDRAHERWLNSAGSSGARQAVLAALTMGRRPMTPSEVADATGRSPNAISPLLHALENEGLIERRANAADRRSHYLALTPGGRRVAQRLRRRDAAFVDALLRSTGQRDRVQLQRGLRALELRAGQLQAGA